MFFVARIPTSEIRMITHRTRAAHLNRASASDENGETRWRSEAFLRRGKDNIETPVVKLDLLRCDRADAIYNHLYRGVNVS